MFDSLRFRPDPLLQDDVILASARTARDLRVNLRGLDWQIKVSPAHTDDQVTVSPVIYQQLCAFMDHLTAIVN